MTTKTTTIAPRKARVIIPRIRMRPRHVYDICELKQTAENGIRYHGFVNYKSSVENEMVFTLVGATSLDRNIWYDLWGLTPASIKALIKEQESRAMGERYQARKSESIKQEFAVGQKVRIIRPETWQGCICTVTQRATDDLNMYWLKEHGWRHSDEIESIETSAEVQGAAREVSHD